MLPGEKLLDLIALARAAVNAKQNVEKKGEGSKIDVMARASDSQLKAQLHWQHGPNRMRLTFLTIKVLKHNNLCCSTTINMFWDDFTSGVQYNVATT